MHLVLRLLLVLLLLLGGLPLASASFSAACAPEAEEEHGSERVETPATARAPTKGDLALTRLEGAARRAPRRPTRRATTPSLETRGARLDRLSPLRC